MKYVFGKSERNRFVQFYYEFHVFAVQRVGVKSRI